MRTCKITIVKHSYILVYRLFMFGTKDFSCILLGINNIFKLHFLVLCFYNFFCFYRYYLSISPSLYQLVCLCFLKHRENIYFSAVFFFLFVSLCAYVYQIFYGCIYVLLSFLFHSLQTFVSKQYCIYVCVGILVDVVQHTFRLYSFLLVNLYATHV